jgi:hypothetical protein
METKEQEVTREIAEQEVTAWLDKKKIFPSTREANKDSIELLIDSIVQGVLVYNSTNNTFVHKLLFPIENEMPINELTYKARINDIQLKPNLSGVKPGDGYGTLLAYVATLTGKNKTILSYLDSTDKKVAMAIAVFFL